MSRPLSISREESLDRALLLFWERGYDLTSISDLSAVLGVGPSSIYNSFGSKDGLFQQALARYMETYAAPAMERLATDDGCGAHAFIEGLLKELVKLYSTKGQPAGCAVFDGAGAGLAGDSQACVLTLQVKDGLQKALRKRFEGFAKSGESLTASPKTLALFTMATLRGLSQLARDGASRGELMKVAEHAAQSFVQGES